MPHTCVLQTHVCLQRQELLVNLKSARCFKTADQYKCVRVTWYAVTGLLNSVASSVIMDNPALTTAAVRLTFSLHVSARKRTYTCPAVSARHIVFFKSGGPGSILR